jgi:hypothetical protein
MENKREFLKYPRGGLRDYIKYTNLKFKLYLNKKFIYYNTVHEQKRFK